MMDFSEFADLPVIDGHVHFIHPEKLDSIRRVLETTRCTAASLVCTPNFDGTTHNPAALFYKAQFPENAFISGALDYRPALAHPDMAPGILAQQVRALIRAGFDGLKLIEGKPMVRKLVPFALDGPQYAELWAVLEAAGFPVILHVADPDVFWDPIHCPAWARENGWDYSGDGYPSKESLYTEMDHVLERHPALKIVFAHFYFLSGDLPRAGRFLDAHPNVCFDLAPHLDMYVDFGRNPVSAQEFFLRYQDRIIYGTDLDTRVLKRANNGEQFVLNIAWIIRSFLESRRRFSWPGNAIRRPDEAEYHGLGLPKSVLAKIYAGNFHRLYGFSPAKLPECSYEAN